MPSETTRTPSPIANYREFWPYYLNEHGHPLTRALHIGGTALAVLVFLAGLVMADARLIAGAILLGYAPAWAAHYFVEHNRPATFRHPVWSLISDFRMMATWFAGGLAQEIDKARIAPRAGAEE